jgi:hypothetical protein
LICDDSNYDLLINYMDKIIHTSAFLEKFEEGNKVAVRYMPYSTKFNEVFTFGWPLDEEYQRWVNRYLDDDE